MNDKLSEALESLKKVKISLPTDEQIREMSNEYARRHTEPKAGYVLNRRFGFQNGAIWMRDLIRDKRSQVEKEIVPTQKICQKCGSELINTEQYGWFCPDIACRIEGQNQHLNNTTYTAEDMESFAEWCSRKGWEYHMFEDEWWNERDEIKTTAQLRELWEQERREK